MALRRKGNKGDQREGYTVTYDSSSHVKVIFQLWGSVWPKVLPYCLFNVFLSAGIQYLATAHEINLAISDKGHSFMNLMVAFLIVARVTINIGRYNEARGYLGDMYRETRALMQNVVVLSDQLDNDQVKEWRNLVAYRSNVLLRTAMAVIDYSDPPHLACWELKELSEEEKVEIQKYIFCDTGNNQGGMSRWKHGHESTTLYEENMRVPIRMAFKLRQALRLHKQIFVGDNQIEVPQELRLMANVDAFLSGYFGIRKFLTTPFPFPLVQMARTFLFFYVFTVPFALLSDTSGVYAHCVTIFILTYGFMGLEYVSIELDNPFGIDDNDFDNLGMAYTTFEDTYLTILNIDGPKWRDELRLKMNENISLDNQTFSDEQSLLLPSSSV